MRWTAAVLSAAAGACDEWKAAIEALGDGDMDAYAGALEGRGSQSVTLIVGTGCVRMGKFLRAKFRLGRRRSKRRKKYWVDLLWIQSVQLRP